MLCAKSIASLDSMQNLSGGSISGNGKFFICFLQFTQRLSASIQIKTNAVKKDIIKNEMNGSLTSRLSMTSSLTQRMNMFSPWLSFSLLCRGNSHRRSSRSTAWFAANIYVCLCLCEQTTVGSRSTARHPADPWTRTCE